MAASLLLTLAMAEGILRLFPDLLPEDASLRIYWRNVVEKTTTTSIGDPYLGFVYPPDHKGEIKLGEVDFSYSTDEHGFRNRGPWPAKPDIVTIGDSLTFSYGVEDEEGWVARLVDQSQDLQILNLGIIGASPQQYARYYERYAAAKQPRLLILGLFPGNDLIDAELFDQWLAAGAEGNYDVWRFFKGRVPGRAQRWKGAIERSYLVTSLGEWKKNLNSPFSSRTMTFDDGSRLRLAAGIRSKNVARTQSDHPTFRRVVEVLSELQEDCDQAGTELLVLLFPTKEEVYLPLLGEPAPLLVEPFAAKLEELGIDHLDLIPALQERGRQGARLYFEIDGHPNAEGYRVIADTVLTYLESEPDLFERQDSS